MDRKQIKTALISVFYKEGLEPIVKQLHQDGVRILSTGGTLDFIKQAGYEAEAVEDITGYPSILGGRVKTLHPKVFGGILNRSSNNTDQEEMQQFEIPDIDLVIVDLYPFEETLASGASEKEIIEKIDIGGISLIRAAAKNFVDVAIVSSRDQYDDLLSVISDECSTDLPTRRKFAASAFDVSSHYDSAIFNYFNGDGSIDSFKISSQTKNELRYGENPHQKGNFYGRMDEVFEQLHGKAISYNNLLDIDAAVSLVQDFDESVFVIIKHTNACGLAIAGNVLEVYTKALAGDPVSAFGGILATNLEIDAPSAEEINKLFFEVLIAPGFSPEALEILKSKKNRILLIQKSRADQDNQVKSVLNGFLVQEKDRKIETKSDLQVVTKKGVSDSEEKALLLANKLVKHSKSNAIVFASEDQLLSSGVGQTSRVDALNHAIEKANKFGFSLKGTVMASDAFFPFPDCVQIADNEGITSIIQPGGSVKDQLSIDYCDDNDMSMVFTGFRHFKH